MNALERDLIRWENGEMTLEQVERAHPEAGVRELMRLHTRLSMLRAIPLPDVEKAWSMTLPMLDRGMTSEPVRSPARSSRLRDWARRPLAASFAAVVMSGGAAYAAGFEPVQRVVDRVWDRAQEVTGLEGSDEGEEESTSVAPADDGDDGSSRGDDASARGRERADEVRGQGKEKGPNHGRRAFGHSHKKDNEASGTEHVPGSPPAHAQNDEAKKPDKDKDKDHNGSGAPEAPGNSGNSGSGPPDAPGNSGNGGGNGVPVEEPEETIDSTRGAPPAPESDSPGATGEDHGNGKDKDK